MPRPTSYAGEFAPRTLRPSVFAPWRGDDEGSRPALDRALRRSARYAAAVLFVAAAVIVRRVLAPIAGTGAPFVPLFTAVILASIVGGTGPGLLAAALAVPTALREFLMAGIHDSSHAPAQVLLFAANCALIVLLTGKANHALHAAERARERLRLSTEASAIVCWDLDVRTGALSWSPRQATEGPFPEGAPPLLDAWVQSLHPDDRLTFQQAHERALDPAGQRRIELELRVPRSDGTTQWVRWLGRTYDDPLRRDIAPARQLGTLIDITPQRERQEALGRATREVTRAAARVRELIELGPDAFFLADLEGRYVEVNQRACQLLGYERHELIGKTIVDLLRPEDVARLDAEKAKLLNSGTVLVSEWMLKRKDGSLVPVEVSANILQDGRWQAFVRDITERRQREEALRESEERFRLAMEEAPIGMALVALDGGLARVNAALCEIVGYAADDLQRLRWQDITHPEDVDADQELADRLFRGEIPRYQLEKRYIRKDGSTVDVMLNGSVLRNARGEALYFIAQIEDITARKHAQQALALSEARFAGIIAIAADAIVSVDEHQRITLFNDAAVSTFGYSRDEALGAPLAMLIPERLRPGHGAHVEAFAREPIAARTMGQRFAAILGRRKGGEEFPAEAAISKLTLGGSTTYTVALRDVTERRRFEIQEKLLAQSGALLVQSLDYDKALEDLGRLVVQEFADLCIVDLFSYSERPRRIRATLGASHRQELARAIEELEQKDEGPTVIRPVLTHRRPYLVEHLPPEEFATMADNAEQRELMLALGVRSMIALPMSIRGRLFGALSVYSTNPARTYGQADLPFAEALAERVALAVENGRFYQAAVQQKELRDQVMGVVAHDLRNPLSAIRMQASALRRKEPDPERHKPSDMILRAASRMDRLIQDLLDITSIEAGQLGLERGRVSTRQLLDDFVEGQRPLAAAQSIELVLQASEDLPQVWVDHHRILQVLENLVTNALKFTGTGGRITVGAVSRGDQVAFSVADTGRGIPPDDLPHVFERFWQAHKGVRRGAGLGLPISRGIVEAHGGRIWVESSVGRGTTFFFTIPVAAPT